MILEIIGGGKRVGFVMPYGYTCKRNVTHTA